MALKELSPNKLAELSKNEILEFVRSGMLSVVIEKKLPTKKEDYPEYKKHAHLAGTPIHLSGASRKYNIPDRTLSRWAARGILKNLGMDKNRKLVDEADVAYCAEIYNARGRQGRWLFNDDGTPYIPTTRPIK